MVYTIEKLYKESVICRYENEFEVSQSIEWQDIYGNAYVIISDDGEVLDIDRSNSKEHGTVYEYGLVKVGADKDLAKKCKLLFEKAGWPNELSINFPQT